MQTTNFPARKPLTVYFDYACPYCFHGVSDLLELLQEYPYFSVTWVPCEAHPLPEPAWVHSGLAGQAMLAVSALGGNVENFHEAVFFALFREKKRIDSSRLLADLAAACGADADKALEALDSGRYKADMEKNNRLVWSTRRFEAVPCYESGSRLLASHEDVLLSKEELAGFLRQL